MVSRKIIFLLVSILLGAWLCLLLRLTPHTALLDIASQTAFSGDDPYIMISNQQLLCFKAAHSSTEEPFWNLMLLDIQTGGETPLTTITRQFPQWTDSPYRVRVSPDGKWLLTRNKDVIFAATLDGSRTLKWTVSYEPMAEETQLTWLNDSRFVSTEQDWRMFTSGKVLMPIVLCSVDAPKTVQHLQATPSSEFFARDYFSSPRFTPNGLLYAYASAYEENDTRTLLTLSLFSREAQRKTVFHAPPGMRFMSSRSLWGARDALSPQGNRIVWLCRSHTFRSPLRVWLHRLFPRIQAPPQQWESLYVSPTTGGKLREIGGVLVDVTAADGQETLDKQQAIQDVRWLPDGKHLSFLLHKRLYTVPAE